MAVQHLSRLGIQPSCDEPAFIDVDVAQRCKHGQHVCGDVFLTQKIKEDGRLVFVVADGLGSGVKASVLANLTATMALKYTAAFVDIRKSAQTIMDTLPICEVRRISYSTFTVVDMEEDGRVRLVEHGNPPVVLLRNGRDEHVRKSTFTVERWADREIAHAEFDVEVGDRLICMSDGVSQSGMGMPQFPVGWERERVAEMAMALVAREPEISSHDLANRLVEEAVRIDGGRARDDVTCAVAYYRHPRRLLVATGPPFAKARDRELAELVSMFPGRIAICGGTTALIVSRQLERPVEMDLGDLDPDVPPISRMHGVDLVTEGTLTLARLAEAMEAGAEPEGLRRNAVRQLLTMMLETDVVEFVVGTRINEAHQDPNVPVELDLRRNLIRRIAAVLESRHRKQARLRFL